MAVLCLRLILYTGSKSFEVAAKVTSRKIEKRLGPELLEGQGGPELEGPELL